MNGAQLAGPGVKILVMGGTRFVGRPLVELLREAGHELTLFTRGRQPLPEGVEHLVGDRAEESGLALLEGRRFDVIVDSSGRSQEDSRRVVERATSASKRRSACAPTRRPMMGWRLT